MNYDKFYKFLGLGDVSEKMKMDLKDAAETYCSLDMYVTIM